VAKLPNICSWISSCCGQWCWFQAQWRQFFPIYDILATVQKIWEFYCGQRQAYIQYILTNNITPCAHGHARGTNQRRKPVGSNPDPITFELHTLCNKFGARVWHINIVFPPSIHSVIWVYCIIIQYIFIPSTRHDLDWWTLQLLAILDIFSGNYVHIIWHILSLLHFMHFVHMCKRCYDSSDTELYNSITLSIPSSCLSIYLHAG
jgi:hypothetical protein